EQAQAYGYTVVDASTVTATHLNHLILAHAAELLGRQETQALLDHLAKDMPKLVEDLVPKALSLGVVQKVLRNLLEEGVHLRDMRTVMETLADGAPRADAVATPAPAKAPPPTRDAVRAPGRAWWPVVAFGGVAVAGLGTFTVAGLAGYREQILLESACAPGCVPGTDAGMRRAYLIADVGLAVSVVALVGALWLGLRSDPATPSSTRAR
ncbi:MAG TPA: FHIPEP family type III secretion protein, partial [Polyangiaceae bacterium]|nr:FHIPEP family type III secretion protein [Polyangiaceae bacterium]